jgi:hypothetical protein
VPRRRAGNARLQAHDSANAQNQAEAWQEERVVSKYAGNLEQLPCTRTIPMDPKQVRSEAFYLLRAALHAMHPSASDARNVVACSGSATTRA